MQHPGPESGHRPSAASRRRAVAHRAAPARRSAASSSAGLPEQGVRSSGLEGSAAQEQSVGPCSAARRCPGLGERAQPARPCRRRRRDSHGLDGRALRGRGAIGRRRWSRCGGADRRSIRPARRGRTALAPGGGRSGLRRGPARTRRRAARGGSARGCRARGGRRRGPGGRPRRRHCRRRRAGARRVERRVADRASGSGDGVRRRAGRGRACCRSGTGGALFAHRATRHGCGGGRARLRGRLRDRGAWVGGDTLDGTRLGTVELSATAPLSGFTHDNPRYNLCLAMY